MSTAADRHRLSRRLVRHHIGLGVASAALCAAVFAALPNAEIAVGISKATAYVGLALLSVTLLIGPLNVLRNQRMALSDDLRRDVGIWGAILSVLHVIIGLQIHMGSPWLYFFYGPEERRFLSGLPIRIDLFGLSNDTGLVATLVLVLLLLLSNDLSMRALGNRRWKRLQQLNYVALAMVVIHGVLYQRIEQREPGWVVLFWILWLAAVIFQLLGVSARMRADRITRPLAPADLA